MCSAAMLHHTAHDTTFRIHLNWFHFKPAQTREDHPTDPVALDAGVSRWMREQGQGMGKGTAAYSERL